MIKGTLQLCIFLAFLGVFGQENNERKSKMQDFASKTGVIIKLEDYNLANIKTSFVLAESRIRKIVSGNEEQFFFQISKKGKYDTKTASIAYVDIIEIQKALLSLKIQSESDTSAMSDYLENKFVTDDGFQVGYFRKKSKITWYLKLEKYGSDNTLYIKEFETLEAAFQLGKEKIEALIK